MEKLLDKIRVKLLRGSETDWSVRNPTPMEGEMIVVNTEEGTKLKVGDGLSKFLDLIYLDAHLEKLKNKVTTILGYESNKDAYPTTSAVYDLVKPYALYATDGTTGLTAINKGIDEVSWQLTGLELWPFRRLKFYVKAGGNSTNYETSPTVVEMYLEDRGSFSGIDNHYVASAVTQHANSENRLLGCTFAVSSDKTSISFLRASSLYGSSASDYSGNGRVCYLIEGYLI